MPRSIGKQSGESGLTAFGRLSVAGPMAWNSLPVFKDFIRDPTSSTDSFRRPYLRRTCLRDTIASKALGVLNDYALYKSSGKSGPKDQVALLHYYTSPSHWCTTHEVSKL